MRAIHALHKRGGWLVWVSESYFMLDFLNKLLNHNIYSATNPTPRKMNEDAKGDANDDENTLTIR